MTREELEEILGIEIKLLHHTKLGKCWIRKGTDWSNYHNLKGERIHRLVYKICVGPIINGRLVCHKCDRPGCFNPGHLFQGTAKQNFEDAISKGRARQLKFRDKKLAEELKELRELDRWKQLVRFAGET